MQAMPDLWLAATVSLAVTIGAGIPIVVGLIVGAENFFSGYAVILVTLWLVTMILVIVASLNSPLPVPAAGGVEPFAQHRPLPVMPYIGEVRRL